MARLSLNALLALLTISALLFSGCSGDNVAGIVAEHNKTNLQKVANVYMLHQSRVGTAVRSEEDLVEFVLSNERIEKNLGFMQIEREEFGQYLEGEDGNEFFIRWGVFVEDRSPPQPLVFETSGNEDGRRIAWSSGKVTVADADEYEKLKRGIVDKNSGFKGPEDFEAEMQSNGN